MLSALAVTYVLQYACKHGCTGQAALQEQDLSCTYLAHCVLEKDYYYFYYDYYCLPCMALHIFSYMHA